MVWFEYKYITFKEILNNITLFSEFWLLEFLILFFIAAFLIIFLYYLIPWISIIKAHKKQESAKNNKSKLIKQILMQKQIEEEIEKEIENYNFTK